MNSAQRTCEVARVILERAAKQPDVTLVHICVAVGEAIGVLRVESVGGPPRGTPEETPPTWQATHVGVRCPDCPTRPGIMEGRTEKGCDTCSATGFLLAEAGAYDASSEDYSRGFNDCRALDRQALESVFDDIGGVSSFAQQYRMLGGFRMWLDAVLPLEEPDDEDDDGMEDDPAGRVDHT